MDKEALCPVCGDPFRQWADGVHLHNPDGKPVPMDLPYTFEDEDQI